jgi:hypothetical protein
MNKWKKYKRHVHEWPWIETGVFKANPGICDVLGGHVWTATGTRLKST